MWFMPSYGRPDRLRQLFDAPGGLPPVVNVIINLGDPAYGDYQRLAGGQWMVTAQPSGRCADAHRMVSQLLPDLPFYGLLCDDQWPITPGWWQAMEEACERRFVVTPAGEPRYPLCRTAVCIGGDLVRAMGSLVPAPLKHNFEDNIWDDVGREHNLLRPLPDYRVEHRHWIRGEADRDATYDRGSIDFSDDQSIYERWLVSDEKKAMDKRIRVMLAGNTSDHPAA